LTRCRWLALDEELMLRRLWDASSMQSPSRVTSDAVAGEMAVSEFCA
jgi:hypothetical protein